ncbi:MAG TPA: hypothetical protein VM120_19260 [Bryobacteraceae bacterium]|nr:hypothetical protein [Bryobacteraceae bacterium]
MLAHHLPQAMKDFQFSEPVWVIGYRTDISDSNGKSPRENYLCHTFFSDERLGAQKAEVSSFDLSLLDEGTVPSALFFVREHYPPPTVSAAG